MAQEGLLRDLMEVAEPWRKALLGKEGRLFFCSLGDVFFLINNIFEVEFCLCIISELLGA